MPPGGLDMIQDNLALARAYEEQERYQEALAEYGKAVKENPQDAEPLLCRGAFWGVGLMTRTHTP